MAEVTADRTAGVAPGNAEEQYRLMVLHAPLGMALITPDGRFLQVNDALCRSVGRSPAEVVELGVRGLVHPADRRATLDMFRDGGTRGRFVKRYLHADGHLVWVKAFVTLVRDPAGDPLGLVCQFEDVTKQERRRKQLLHQALHDHLTGLPNRAMFDDRAVQALARTRRQREMLAVLFSDLDDFKDVNDRFGHRAGDGLLRTVATRLRGCVREVDTVARFGGDEFVLLLDALTSPDEALATAARIQDALQQPLALAGQEVVISASIGIAMSSPEVASIDMLLRNADAAMYQAKADGGGRSRVFEPAAPRGERA